MKTLILPECIRFLWQSLCPSAKTSERRHVLIIDLEFRKSFGELLRIVLRVGPRPRNSAHIHNQPDVVQVQQRYKLINRTRRVSNGKELVRHDARLRRRVALGAIWLSLRAYV